MPRRLGVAAFVLLIGLVLAKTGAWAVDSWRIRTVLDRARQSVAHGQFREAQADLEWIQGRRPRDGEPAYLLGVCAAGLGQTDKALEAWALVPDRSPLKGTAALRRGRVAIDCGRFLVAEEALTSAIRHGGEQAIEARSLLLRLLWREARFGEVANLIEDQWRELARTGQLSTAAAIDLLSGHLALDLETFPIDEVVRELQVAAIEAPGDDRVRVGLARWALRAGRHDEAGTLLSDCGSPEHADPVIWHARLDWARATGRVNEARQALAHLPASPFTKTDLLTLRAWLAAQGNDNTAERAALDELVALDPSDLTALERLAELVHQAGDLERAARLRTTKTRLDSAKFRYQTHLKNGDLATRPLEMYQLADELGRRFERMALLTLAGRKAPADPAVRKALALPASPGPPPLASRPGQTLADLLAANLVTKKGEERPKPPGPTPLVPRFIDAAESVSLRFAFDNGATSICQLPEVMSGGVGLLDVNGDGYLDVLALQGGSFPPRSNQRHGGDRLFLNRSNGTFEDITDRSGLSVPSEKPQGYSHGVAVGDYDGDGHADLFITRWRGYALYRNRGDGRFDDVTEQAGLGGDRDWPTSAAFADLDGDGDLDLYVCHYLKWDAEHPRLCPNAAGTGYLSCDPRHFKALPDHLFRNDNGRFVDVTQEAVPADIDGRGLGVVVADLDGDGRVDLFVANDGTANYLLRNLGGFRFEEVALTAGVACNAGGSFQAGMGTAVGDLDGDGNPDLFVTNFYGESTTYFSNLGQGLFADRTAAIGLAAPSRSVLGFGVALFDANNDGFPDLVTANGHVNDSRPAFPFAMPTQLLLGDRSGRLTEVTGTAGAGWSVPRIGRGLATGDLDNDGRIDVVVIDQAGPLAVFQNRTEKAGHFLTLGLSGAPSNGDSVGAVVTVKAGGRAHHAWRVGGGSYLSASDSRLHFGLNASTHADEVVVRWPSGRLDRHQNLTADSGYLLREGSLSPQPLPGFSPAVR
ncbi:CRTAC1 family protein [Singulisphaera acidiphila]|uniref:Thioredoxin domain-containing protein n=1 Tax=Singulisphaera acidiphila (strain ATCC BAA-1392 / DSM 18658 / VKM B-2454 / MOB10) TaxID=886293 RepID=L0DPF8_SINAD|nr:CRTAC1 family protein [Singulisphaera acidiphila]AGA31254.1 thioredoxin domain-containing protein [Singulisphaera acidiphila DSM 18658]